MERKSFFSFLNKVGTLGIILIIIIFVYLLLAKSTHLWPFNKNYQMVVLENGITYFGHLKFFPRPCLTEVYFIQNQQDEKGNIINQQLMPISSGGVLNSKSKIYLSFSKVLWWADLPEESQILNLIKSYKLQTSLNLPQSQPQTQPQQSFFDSGKFDSEKKDNKKNNKGK